MLILNNNTPLIWSDNLSLNFSTQWYPLWILFATYIILHHLQQESEMTESLIKTMHATWSYQVRMHTNNILHLSNNDNWSQNLLFLNKIIFIFCFIQSKVNLSVVLRLSNPYSSKPPPTKSTKVKMHYKQYLTSK